jgi:hypothetical protein
MVALASVRLKTRSAGPIAAQTTARPVATTPVVLESATVKSFVAMPATGAKRRTNAADRMSPAATSWAASQRTRAVALICMNRVPATLIVVARIVSLLDSAAIPAPAQIATTRVNRRNSDHCAEVLAWCAAAHGSRAVSAAPTAILTACTRPVSLRKVVLTRAARVRSPSGHARLSRSDSEQKRSESNVLNEWIRTPAFAGVLAFP